MRTKQFWHNHIRNLYNLLSDKKFLRYAVSGLSSLAADYGSFILLYYVLGVGLSWTVPLSLGSGLVVSFAMNKLWAFRSDANANHRYAIGLQVILFLGIFTFNTVFTYIFVRTLSGYGVSAALGKISSVCFILVWNYLFFKKVIFRVSEQTQNLDN